MRAKLVKIVGMGIVLLAFGCRTPKPDLKPPPVAEALNTPPAEKRYDTPTYPKEASFCISLEVSPEVVDLPVSFVR